MTASFPSIEFFSALRDAMRAEKERFRRLGFFDTTFGIRVLREGAPAAEFTLGFEVYDLVSIRPGLAASEVDFTLEGPLAVWREMFDTIHRLGAADADHSLNTLTHFGDHLKVVYDDPTGHDALYRFAESIQEYFDLSARIDFTYPDGSAPPLRSAA